MFLMIAKFDDKLIHLPLDKTAAISRTTLSNLFLWMSSFIFWFKFTKCFPYVSNWQLGSIGSGDGLAPNGTQAITRTNADSVHWRT